MDKGERLLKWPFAFFTLFNYACVSTYDGSRGVTGLTTKLFIYVQQFKK